MTLNGNRREERKSKTIKAFLDADEGRVERVVIDIFISLLGRCVQL